MYANTSLALMAVQEADVEAASRHYDALRPRSGLPSISGEVSLDRVLGLLAMTIGHPEVAVEHFEDAVAFCRKAGYLPELAWSCYDYSSCLLQRNPSTIVSTGEDEYRIASLMIDEALEITQRISLPALRQRLLELQTEAQARPAMSPTYPDGLTHREVEVLKLIAAGKTDREIASELFLSSRTVNNHVRSILNKTAVANRTEAATYAALHGLILPQDRA